MAEFTEPQPYKVKGGHFVCFALAADRGVMQAIVDRYFHEPSNNAVEYRVMSDYLIAGNLHIADSRSTSRADEDINAFYVESDLLIFIPVASGKTSADGEFHIERMVWFVPLVFVDTSCAVAEGREVYGFPKLLATCVSPRVANDPAYFSVRTGVYQGVQAARQLRDGTVFEAIRHDAGTFGQHDVSWTSGFEALTGMVKLLDVKTSGAGLIESAKEKLAMFSSDQRLLVLKQFRDARQGDRACLIQIVECPITVDAFQGAGLVEGDWTVQFMRYPTLNLATDLGILGGSEPIKPLAVYWVKLDCTMQNGIVTWESER